MSKVSIVIPCYNVSAYIERCVRALENQTYKDFTAIFVDDCSTDDTAEKIEYYKETSNLDIVFLKNKVNSGPAVSRNNGTQYANSEYITFCDCDDWYEPEFLETFFNCFSDREVDIAFCGYHVVDEKGNKDERQIISESKTMAYLDALRLDADSLCMLMVRTDIMKQTPLPDLRNGEDMAVVPLLISRSRKCIALSKCMYNYFRRADSASQKPTMKVVDSLVSSFEHVKQYFPVFLKRELEYIGIKNLLYSSIISLFSFSYDKEKAEQIIRDFEKDFPDWFENSYINHLSSYKKVVLKLIHKRRYRFIKWVAIIRNFLTR